MAEQKGDAVFRASAAHRRLLPVLRRGRGKERPARIQQPAGLEARDNGVQRPTDEFCDRVSGDCAVYERHRRERRRAEGSAGGGNRAGGRFADRRRNHGGERRDGRDVGRDCQGHFGFGRRDSDAHCEAGRPDARFDADPVLRRAGRALSRGLLVRAGARSGIRF